MDKINENRTWNRGLNNSNGNDELAVRLDFKSIEYLNEITYGGCGSIAKILINFYYFKQRVTLHYRRI